MNILLVSDVYLPTVSGVAASTDSIAKHLVSQGHTVFLACPKPTNPITQNVERLHIIYTTSLPDPFFVGKRMAFIPFGMNQIWQILKKNHIDIAHIQEPVGLGLMTLICCKIRHIPTVGALHTSIEQIRLIANPIIRPFIPAFMNLYLRIIYPNYDGIMVPTNTVVNFLRPLLGPKKIIRAVSNGVDTNEFTPITNNIQLRKELHTPSNKTLFLHVGRLDSDKNIETIFRALTLTGPNVHLLLAGIGKQEMMLREFAQKLDVNKKITWIGRVDKPKMIQWYQAADAFVIMSPVETQSIVALQAIATGLPLIAARAGALPELVSDNISGFLLDTYDYKSLAKHMDLLAHDQNLRKRMGKEGRTLSLPHHKPVALSELVKLFEQILTKKG